jgi:large subunit ribosomal protein L4
MATKRKERADVSVEVRDLSGKKAGTASLPGDWFDVDVNVPVMHQVVTAQLAAARQGTHKTKTRGEVSGGGRKPFKQKGTGRARQGSIRAPQWTGGGVAHGRTPKDWSQRVNRKMRRLALASALTDRRTSDALIVVRGFTFEAPSTKSAVAALAALGVSGRVLLVLADWDEAALLSVRNLPGVHVLLVDQLNTHDVLVSDVLVIDERAIPLIGTGLRADEAAELAEVGA